MKPKVNGFRIVLVDTDELIRFTLPRATDVWWFYIVTDLHQNYDLL